jgi:glutamate synthase domain-containing protein 2
MVWKGVLESAPEVVNEHTGIPTLAALMEALNGLKRNRMKDTVESHYQPEE